LDANRSPAEVANVAWDAIRQVGGFA